MIEPTKEQIEREIIDAESRTSPNLIANSTVRSERTTVCNTCPAKMTLYGLDACGDCNCILGFKIPIISSVCPRGKW